MSKATYKQLDLSGKIKETDLSEDTQSALNKTDLSSNNETVTFYCDCDSSSDVLDNDLISDYSNINSAISFSSVSDFDTTDIDSSDKKFGDASFNFNRSNYSLLIPKSGNISVNGKFSISVWIKVNGEINRTIYSDADGILKLSIDADGKAKATIYHENIESSIISTTSVNSNEWMNIIVSGETNSSGEDSLMIYVDGDKESSISDQTFNVNENSSSNFILGSGFNNDNATVVNMGSLPSLDGLTFSGDDESDCSVSDGTLEVNTIGDGVRTASYEKTWVPTMDSDLKLGLPCDFNADSVEGKNAITDTMIFDRATKKFGRASFYMNEINTRLEYQNNGTDFNMFGSLTTSYTLDFWIKTTKESGNHIINQLADTTTYWRMYTNGSSETLKFYIYENGGVNDYLTTSVTISNNQWHHVAIIKVNSDVSMYIDGIRVDDISLTGTISSNGPINVGYYNGSYLGQGNIDELRLTQSNPFNADPTTANPIVVPSKSVFDACYYETKAKLEQVEEGSAIPDKTTLMIPADDSNSSIAGRLPINITDLDTVNKKFNKSSLKFNGTTDFVSFADSDNWNICGSNSDDWTISLWVKHTDHSGDEYYIEQYVDTSNYWMLDHVDGSGIRFSVNLAGTNIIATGFGGEITDTNWHHVALVKKANEYAIYLDGIQTSYVQDSDTATFNGLLRVGASYYGGSLSYQFDGNMDDVVISQSNIFSATPNSGKTDTITVPTAPLVKDANTRLMIKADETCNSEDSYAIPMHSTSLSSSIIKFGNGAMKFNGTSDYVQYADSADWDLVASNSDDWTVAFWIKPNIDISSINIRLMEQHEDADSNYWEMNLNSGALGFLMVSGGVTSIKVFASTEVISDTGWHHIAFVKKASEYAFYLDGVQGNYLSDSSTDTFSAVLNIGSSTSGGNYMNGYIDELLISHSNIFSASPNSGKTDTITVPTSALVDDANTKLHITADSNCNSSEGKSATNTTTIIHNERKFGDNSLFFNGESDYASFPDSDNWDICKSNSDDWTISLWARHSGCSGYDTYIDQIQDGSNYWNLTHISGSGLRFYSQSGGSEWINTGTAGEITDSEWHHITLVKKGDEYACYLDGAQVTYTQDSSIVTFAGDIVIGQHNGGSYFNGYLDDIVIAHSNIFSASPNSGLTDTIAVPTTSLGKGKGSLDYKISNGSYESIMRINDNSVIVDGTYNEKCIDIDTSKFNTYRHILQGSKSFVYINGVLKIVNTANVSNNSKVVFGDCKSVTDLNIKAQIDNFKYDQSNGNPASIFNNELKGNIDSLVVIDNIIISDTVDQLQTAAGKDIAPGTRDGAQIRNIDQSHLAIDELIDEREYEEAPYMDIRDYCDASGERLSYNMQFSTKKRVIPTITVVTTNSVNLSSVAVSPSVNGIYLGLSASGSGYTRWEGSWTAQCASKAKIFDITISDFKCVTGKILFDSLGQKNGYDETIHTVLLSDVTRDRNEDDTADAYSYSFTVDGVKITIPMLNEEQKISWIYGLDSDHLSAQSLKLVNRLTNAEEYDSIQESLRSNPVNKKEIRNEFLKFYDELLKLRTSVYFPIETFALNNKVLILNRIDAGEKYVQDGDL